MTNIKDIEYTLNELDKISFEQLDNAIKETDKEMNKMENRMEKENDLKLLKSHIEEFINNYDINYLGIEIQEVKELEYNAMNNDSSNKIVRISIEY